MHIKAVIRITVSLLAGGLAGVLAYSGCGDAVLSLLVMWDVFAALLILASVREFAAVKEDRIKELVAAEDDSTWLLFGIVITACVVSLVMLVFSFPGGNTGMLLKILSILAVALSWILLHTSFTFRYAHMYYGDNNLRYSGSVRGLDFPGDEDPDYFDFAYFSFVLGMTFQVSDVSITSKAIRRLTLLHSMIAFVFNTVIVVLTVSQLIG